MADVKPSDLRESKINTQKSSIGPRLASPDGGAPRGERGLGWGLHPDFSWSQRPAILRLGPELADRCFQFLRPKRKARSVMDLHSVFQMECYAAFSEVDLLHFLRKDSRFVVRGEDWEAKIKTA